MLTSRAFYKGLDDHANKLYDLLKKGNISVTDALVVKKIGVVPYFRNAKFEVERVLAKAGFFVWSENSDVLVYRKDHYPIQVLKDRVLLLGQTTPDWDE